MYCSECLCDFQTVCSTKKGHLLAPRSQGILAGSPFCGACPAWCRQLQARLSSHLTLDLLWFSVVFLSSPFPASSTILLFAPRICTSSARNPFPLLLHTFCQDSTFTCFSSFLEQWFFSSSSFLGVLGFNDGHWAPRTALGSLFVEMPVWLSSPKMVVCFQTGFGCHNKLKKLNSV
jgi:hypothetical protein